MSVLVDSYSRKFVYLRLSVTERCNFRCVYCLPNGYEPSRQDAASPFPAEMTTDEIRRLVSAFAALGITKVRLTGGEPTVRRDIVEIAEAVASVPGIRKLAITTNGYRLKEIAKPLRAAGVSAVNVSIDSLDEDKFKKITGTDRLRSVLEGIDQAIQAGISTIKVNAVLLKGCNDDEVALFTSWVRERPVSVRFIELMRTGKNAEFFKERHLTAGGIQFDLLRGGWSMVAREHGDGPAVVYSHPDYQGTVGVIAPYSSDFCTTCNRLRVSCRGDLRLCLFGEKDEPLRDLLADDSSHERLVGRLRRLVVDKAPSHLLHEGKYGNTWNLAGIGG